MKGVHIVFLHGLFGGRPVGYSLGLDALIEKAKKLSGQVTANVFEYYQEEAAFQDAVEAYRRGCILVLGGHSLGSSASARIANRLVAAGKPVGLLFVFDPTWNSPAPPIQRGVARAFDFYGTAFSLLGHDQLEAAPGFNGFLRNIGIAVLHQNVDDDWGAHKLFLQEIAWLLDPRNGSAVMPATVKTAPLVYKNPHVVQFDQGNQPSGQ